MITCRAEGEEAWQPDYASLTWVVQHSLRLGAPHVLGDSHRKVPACHTSRCRQLGCCVPPTARLYPAALFALWMIWLKCHCRCPTSPSKASGWCPAELLPAGDGVHDHGAAVAANGPRSADGDAGHRALLAPVAAALWRYRPTLKHLSFEHLLLNTDGSLEAWKPGSMSSTYCEQAYQTAVTDE